MLTRRTLADAIDDLDEKIGEFQREKSEVYAAYRAQLETEGTRKDAIKTGYPPKELDAWADRLKAFAKGSVPKDLELVDPKSKPKAVPRDVFAYVIHEGKVRAPAAAMELIERVK